MELTESDARSLFTRRDARVRSALDRQWRAKLGVPEALDDLDPGSRQAADFGSLDAAAIRQSPNTLTDRVKAAARHMPGPARNSTVAARLTAPDFKLARFRSDIDLSMHQLVPPPGETTQVKLLKASPVTVFNPGYAWWERQAWSLRVDGGSIRDNASYLNGGTGGVGARLWGQNYNAGNASAFDLLRGNGILLPYTLPKTGIPLIEVRLRADFCEHSIWTRDEIGISSCSVVTRESLECGILWKWEDEVLQGASSVPLVPGLFTASTSFSSFGGTGKAVFASAGDTRNVQIYPKAPIPKGAQIWIYIGTQCRVVAALDDVSASAWINSSWTIPEVAVATVSL